VNKRVCRKGKHALCKLLKKLAQETTEKTRGKQCFRGRPLTEGGERKQGNETKNNEKKKKNGPSAILVGPKRKWGTGLLKGGQKNENTKKRTGQQTRKKKKKKSCCGGGQKHEKITLKRGHLERSLLKG